MSGIDRSVLAPKCFNTIWAPGTVLGVSARSVLCNFFFAWHVWRSESLLGLHFRPFRRLDLCGVARPWPDRFILGDRPVACNATCRWLSTEVIIGCFGAYGHGVYAARL